MAKFLLFINITFTYTVLMSRIVSAAIARRQKLRRRYSIYLWQIFQTLLLLNAAPGMFHRGLFWYIKI